MNYPGLVELARNRGGKSIWEIDGIAEALPALEGQRKRDFEDWMDKQDIDLVVFPANGDVGRSDLDTNDESARHALQNGVKYSNGNRALRHMGVRIPMDRTLLESFYHYWRLCTHYALPQICFMSLRYLLTCLPSIRRSPVCLCVWASCKGRRCRSISHSLGSMVRMLSY